MTQTKEIQVVTVRMPREMHEALRVFAHVTDTSINETILRACGAFLAMEGRNEETRALIAQMSDRYRVALDKLADL